MLIYLLFHIHKYQDRDKFFKIYLFQIQCLFQSMKRKTCSLTTILLRTCSERFVQVRVKPVDKQIFGVSCSRQRRASLVKKSFYASKQ